MNSPSRAVHGQEDKNLEKLKPSLGAGSFFNRRAGHPRKGVLPPRMNLRRAISYNNDKGPLSSTSSRFNFNHLVFSPPPSPGLPSLSPPVKKPKKAIWSIRPIRLVRYSIRILSIVAVFFIALEVLTQLFGPDVPINEPQQQQQQTRAQTQPVQKQSLKIEPTPKSIYEVEMTSQKEAPDFPTPIVVTDHRGKAKWTVSIPPGTPFPLRPNQYAEMCRKCQQVTARTQELRSQGNALQQLSYATDSSPHNGFIDVLEAQKAGYLPGPKSSSEWGYDMRSKPVCKKSLTFVLESRDAGLGRALLLLWTAYGLAQKEGRAFFIDDTRWQYGKYSDIFDLPTAVVPDCARPPTHEIVPCPRQARHLVVSAATADEYFSVLTIKEESSSTTLEFAHDRTSLRHQFQLARQGYDALFRLNTDDGNYVETRTRQLAAKRIVPKTRGQQMGIAVGVHVRRGDRHPLEYQYSRSYLPLNVYSDLGRDLIDAKFGRSSGGAGGGRSSSSSHGKAEDAEEAKKHSIMILASDDPMVYESQEFMGGGGGGAGGGGGGGIKTFPAQARIKLAHKEMIERDQEKKKEKEKNNNKNKGKEVAVAVQEEEQGKKKKYVDETFGWEGGFFAAMFWSLGMTTPNNAAAAKMKSGQEQEVSLSSSSSSLWTMASASAETLRLRSLVGRAYMMDLAVLADASDVVVCTVSSYGCRLLAVMMGWESAIERQEWKNVDGGVAGWIGID